MVWVCDEFQPFFKILPFAPVKVEDLEVEPGILIQILHRYEEFSE